MLEFYEDYFKIDYVLPKQDLAVNMKKFLPYSLEGLIASILIFRRLRVFQEVCLHFLFIFFFVVGPYQKLIASLMSFFILAAMENWGLIIYL